MAITLLSLSYLRSHKNTTLNIDPRPVAIYGPNGGGKTNVLEGISLLSPGRGLRGATARDMIRQPDNLGWKIKANLKTAQALHHIETVFEGEPTRKVFIDDMPVAQTRLAQLIPIIWLTPPMDRLWQEGSEGRRRFLDRLTLSLIPEHGDCSLTYNRAMRERNRLLKDGIQDPAWYSAIETQMAQAGALVGQNRRLALARIMAEQNASTSAFPTAVLSITNKHSTTPITDYETLARALRDNRRLDMAAGRSLAGPHRDDLNAVYHARGMPANMCSTGEQKALLISVILASARALSQDFATPPLVLLDEISAHLDETRRAALYDEICALGAQAWMTGTEAHLFESLGDRAQYLNIQPSDGGSKIAYETVKKTVKKPATKKVKKTANKSATKPAKTPAKKPAPRNPLDT